MSSQPNTTVTVKQSVEVNTIYTYNPNDISSGHANHNPFAILDRALNVSDRGEPAAERKHLKISDRSLRSSHTHAPTESTAKPKSNYKPNRKHKSKVVIVPLTSDNLKVASSTVSLRPKTTESRRDQNTVKKESRKTWTKVSTSKPTHARTVRTE